MNTPLHSMRLPLMIAAALWLASVALNRKLSRPVRAIAAAGSAGAAGFAGVVWAYA